MVEKDHRILSDSDYSSIERRHTPRINAVFEVHLQGNKLGYTLNINETGTCLKTTRPLDLKKSSIKIVLPSQPVTVEISPIWSKKDKKTDDFLLGAKFVNPTEEILSLIRKSLVYRQLRFVIKNVKDRGTKAEIVKFAKSFKQYLFDLFALTCKIEENMITKEKAILELTALNNSIMKKGDLLEQNINNRRLMKKLKQDFRALVGSWAYKSYIVKRSLDKPRGYPGDHKILETIYNKQLLSNGIGWFFDQYFQYNEYAIAVRNRKDKMKDILDNFISSAKNDDITIMNIACGSNREIRELFTPEKEHSLDKKIQFNLIDHDTEALEYSKKTLPQIPNIKYNFMTLDVLNIIKEPKYYKKEFGFQDLIYSIGLADYLPDRVLGRLLNLLFDLLKKNGQLIIAHKDIARYKPLPPNWFCDWNFYPRDKTFLLGLIKKYIDFHKITIDIAYEKSGHILFITLTKGNKDT